MIKKINNNLFKIMYVISIYLVLIIILFLVVKYKVKFEDKDFSEYLYFYNCSSKLCTSTIKQEEYYSKYKCQNTGCPYIQEINNNYVLLNENDNKFIYNYEEGSTILKDYNNYIFTNKDNIIVELNNKYGVVNSNNETLLELNYDNIEYDYNIFKVTLNNKIGYISEENNINIEPLYKDSNYINNKYFYGIKEDKYQIYDYKNNNISDITYNYIYSESGYVFCFDSNKLDILDSNLKSVLISKINTSLNYKEESEQKKLKFRVEKGNLLFNITNEQNKIIVYSFNLETGKLNNS